MNFPLYIYTHYKKYKVLWLVNIDGTSGMPLTNDWTWRELACPIYISTKFNNSSNYYIFFERMLLKLVLFLKYKTNINIWLSAISILYNGNLLTALESLHINTYRLELGWNSVYKTKIQVIAWTNKNKKIN